MLKHAEKSTMQTNGQQAGRTYLGVIERITPQLITGWCLSTNSNNVIEMTNAIIKFGDKEVRVSASSARPDLRQRFGVNFGHFTYQVPTEMQSTHAIVYFDDGTAIPAFTTARSKSSGNLDDEHDAYFEGWASTNDKIFATVRVFHNDIPVVETVASYYREDLHQQGINDGYAGFKLRIPHQLRGIGEVDIKIMVDDVVLFAGARAFSPPSVLIVSETERLEDASRHYRCDNLRLLLQREGVDAQVIGYNEFCAKEWLHFDAIVFARCGADDEIIKKIKRYKEQHAIKIIYEIDDLVFMPWHTFDLGSVRSGVDKAEDPRLKDMFKRRLRILSLADAAITTTEKIASHLSEMGINCLRIPNLLKSHEFKRKKPSSSERLELLCMSGSPTHFRDFKEIESSLEKILTRYRDRVHLTLLGSFKSDLPLLKLSNVTHTPRLPYGKMLQTIDQSDVCLVPLEITEFNNAKSCLKFIECASREVPVLASATEDYVSAIDEGIDGFIARSKADWEAYIESFIRNKDLLQSAGKKAYEHALVEFNASTRSFGIKNFIMENSQ